MRDDAAGPAADTDPTPGGLYGSRRFLPLFLVQALGAFNDNVYKNAFIALLTYRLSAGLEMSLPALAAIAAGVFILPFALFAPFAGQIADSVDKARMMRWVKFAEIVIMMMAAVAYHVQNVPFLYAILFLMGAQSAFFAPIKYGVLPQYLRPSELLRGNGYIQAATFLAILSGTIAGTQLVLTEIGVTLVSIAVIAIAVVGWIASLYAPAAPPVDGELDLLPNYGLRAVGDGGVEVTLKRAAPALALSAAAIAIAVGFGGAYATEIALAALALIWATHLLWPSIADSIAAARVEPVAFRAILAIAWFWYVAATFMALLPAFAKEQLGADEDVFTLLLAAFSVGVAIGAAATGLMARNGVAVGAAPWGALGIALFSVDLWFAVGGSPQPAGEYLMSLSDFLYSAGSWRILFDFVAIAICSGLYVTPLNAVYQGAAPADARGRVVASSNMIDSTLMASSAGVILALQALALSPQQIFALTGATGLVAALVVARWAPETGLGRFALALWPARTAG